jgi:hypothetical protein
MPTISYKGKLMQIPPELFGLFISASTKDAHIILSKSSLVPGEPFTFDWVFEWSPTQQPSHPSLISAKVLWGDHLIWELDPSKGLWVKYGGKWIASSSKVGIIDDSVVPDEFYQPGVKQIDLEVLWKGQDWDGTTSGTVKTSDWLVVTLDDPVGNWWEWTSEIERPNLELDQKYHLTGNITNRHKFADAQTVIASLWRWEEPDEHEADAKEMKDRTPDNLPLAPNALAPIEFGSFKIQWVWMDDCDPWTFKPSKRLRYQVRLDVIDQFGNSYKDIAPQTSGVVGHVPKSTRLERALSCGISIGGTLSKLIGGLFSPVGVALLGGSYYLEDGLIKAELNPVQPDPDFKSKVIRPEIPFDPEDAAFGKGLPATRKFLRVGIEISLLDNMRRSVLGKILGARRARQPQDERNQRAACSKVSKELKAKVQTLQKLSNDADAELVKLLLRVDTNLPDEIRLERLNGVEKLPPELLDRFMDLLALPDLEERVRNSQSFRYTAEALSRAVSVIEKENTKRLSGAVRASLRPAVRSARSRRGAARRAPSAPPRRRPRSRTR